jgi:hypothetical protein
MNLDSISIATPCNVPWSSMRGDDRARFCDRWSLTVHNLGAFTRAGAMEFIGRREGRTCINFVRRFDGTVMTRDCRRGVGFYVRRELAFRLPRSGVQWGSLTFAVGVALLLLLALGTLFGDNIKAIFGMEAGGMPMGDVTLERRTDIRRPALPPSETHDPRTAIPGFPRRPTNSNH